MRLRRRVHVDDDGNVSHLTHKYTCWRTKVRQGVRQFCLLVAGGLGLLVIASMMPSKCTLRRCVSLRCICCIVGTAPVLGVTVV